MKLINRTASPEAKPSVAPRRASRQDARGDSRNSHRASALPRKRGILGRLGVVPFVFAFLALAGFTFADIPVTGGITGNSITYTVSFGPANAGSNCVITAQNASTNQSITTNHTTNSSGQAIGTAYFSGGIQGGDTINVTVYQANSTGELEVVAMASFKKPKPPLIVRWARALQRAVQEILG